LAVFNPNSVRTVVKVEVFDRDGALVGWREVPLESRQRISRTLVELVPESAGQIRGYVVLSATQPVVAQQLFGNARLDYYSAVVPSVVE
jgi:hypothetical protein